LTSRSAVGNVSSARCLASPQCIRLALVGCGLMTGYSEIESLQWNGRILGSRVADGESEGFDAPDEADGPGFLGGEAGVPDGENLRTLIDAFETFLGLRNRFNRRDPELFRR